MKKAAAASLAALILLSSAGCWGPQMLSRRFDDWTNQSYVDNPWLVGNVVACVLAHGILGLTGVVDTYINAYYFWFLDAGPLGDGIGKTYTRRPVTPTPKGQ